MSESDKILATEAGTEAPASSAAKIQAKENARKLEELLEDSDDDESNKKTEGDDYDWKKYMEPEDPNARETIDAEAIQSRERMIPVRLLYLAKELCQGKPVASESYWEKAHTWIDGIMKIIDETFQFDKFKSNHVDVNKEQIKKVFDELSQRIYDEDQILIQEEGDNLTDFQTLEINEFWNKEHFGGKYFFKTELFDWMIQSYNYICEKMVLDKADVFEDSVKEVMKLASDYVEKIF